MAKVSLLLKFGEKQHIENLLNEGQIYMQRIGHYRDLEKDEIQKSIKRADKYDGLYERRKIENEKIYITIGDHEIELKAKNVDYRLDEIMNSYIYCMAGITPERLYDYKNGKLKRLIPKSLEKFGEYCAVITDISDFIYKFKEHFEIIDRAFIEYIDLANANGIIGPLKKDIAFKDQLEYRFIVKNRNGTKEPLKGKIGPLNGFLVATAELEELLTKRAVAVIKNEDKEERIGLIDFIINFHEGKYMS